MAMLICPIHDVVYQDSGKCWCCVLANVNAPAAIQEKRSSDQLLAAEQAFKDAQYDVTATFERVQEQLDYKVRLLQAQLQDAQIEANKHKQTPPTQKQIEVTPAPASAPTTGA